MGKPRIVVLEGDLLGKVFNLSEGVQTIGRGDDVADIVIPDKSISKVHATLEIRGDLLYIIDKDSTNGIFFQRERVRQATVKDQQFFAVGDIYFRFEAGEDLADVLKDFQTKVTSVMDELRRKIVGQQDVLDQIIASIFAGGHCLMVGVPGLAKTVTVNSLSQVLDLSFKRVQFTPDLMPSDITGTNIISENEDGAKGFKFVEGPIFTQLLLADEINRTPPKTQAALLEAMQEKQVTVGDKSMPLPKPFIVIATQNPIEQEGTYVLPEAQLDRFMFNIYVDYPSMKEEEEILRRTTIKQDIPLKRIMSAKDILLFQHAVQQIEVSSYVISYAARIVRATRLSGEDRDPEIAEMLEWGAGPRAGQYLIWGAKAFAAMEGRMTVTCDDIRKCAIPVMRHRISPNFQAQAQGISSDDIVRKIVEKIKEPEIPKFV
ncbi:MAG: AAA family ATPase [Lentisphaeraceae bacterium]|nr:AAA family ATPase [Lentisphaeraceae bacterium]